VGAVDAGAADADAGLERADAEAVEAVEAVEAAEVSEAVVVAEVKSSEEP
jgi:hypothetical protein